MLMIQFKNIIVLIQAYIYILDLKFFKKRGSTTCLAKAYTFLSAYKR